MISSHRRPIFSGTGLLSLLLALLTLLFCGCEVLFPEYSRESAAQPAESEAVDPRQMPRFSEIVYTRPDLEALCGNFDALCGDLTENRLSRRDALSRLQTVYREYNDFYTMRSVAELRYYHDITDSFYADEFDWFLESEPEVDQCFVALCRSSANCELAYYLDYAFWGGWVVEEYGDTDDAPESSSWDSAFYDLIRQENAILSEYHRITADPTVFWQGEERSYLELSWDDSLGSDEWTQISSLYYEKYTPILGELYIRLVKVRQQMADYLGLSGYEEYAYYALYDRDYSPAKADGLLTDIREILVPVYTELGIQARWNQFRYTELNEAENLEALGCAAEAMGGSIAEAYEDLERYELYDIAVSEKKGDTSFQCYLYSYNQPFVFVKTEGFSDDILNFGHEFGHFTDAWYNYNATDNNDLCEVFSQGMEYLLLSRVPEDYREELTEFKLLDTLDTFLGQGSFAEFEHEVYARPAAEWTVEELNALSLRLARDYGYLRSDAEEYYGKNWIDITHFFDRPFYVVSYCVSNAAAFQIYERECAEPDAGLDCWNDMLPRNRDSFLETVIRQGGLEDPFAPGRMEKVAALLREKLGGG